MSHPKNITAPTMNELKNAFTGILPGLKAQDSKTLYATSIDTELGPLLAIADDKHLYYLTFKNWRHLKRDIGRIRKENNAIILVKETKPLVSIKNELEQYFKAKLKRFKTPLLCIGTLFQKEVWKEIHKIPYGQTRSYADIAMLLGKPSAYRAVANANAINRFCIITPCHRVINHNGGLGGYGSGLDRKKWLIEHESSHVG